MSKQKTLMRLPEEGNNSVTEEFRMYLWSLRQFLPSDMSSQDLDDWELLEKACNDVNLFLLMAKNKLLFARIAAILTRGLKGEQKRLIEGLRGYAQEVNGRGVVASETRNVASFLIEELTRLETAPRQITNEIKRTALNVV